MRARDGVLNWADPIAPPQPRRTGSDTLGRRCVSDDNPYHLRFFAISCYRVHRNTDMPNLTVFLDETLLENAKNIARGEHISPNRLVRDVLAQRVATPDSERLSLNDWFVIADRTSINPPPLADDGGRGWVRFLSERSFVKTFLDTNVLAYAVDPRDSAKRTRARQYMFEAKAASNMVVLTHIMLEFHSVLTGKLRMDLCPITIAGAGHQPALQSGHAHERPDHAQIRCASHPSPVPLECLHHRGRSSGRV